MSTKRNLMYMIVAFLSMANIGQLVAQTQNRDWPNIGRYTKQNKELLREGSKITAVFIGNSITDAWASSYPSFFTSNNYVGRGISGQTTPQFLARFREDVINLKPKVVVINGGINDIAENTGPYNHEFTIGNIKSMAELAHANGIKVVLTSVLPAANIPWNKDIAAVPDKVDRLNREIKAYAQAKKFTYVDYYSSLVNTERGMKAEYTSDGVHVTAEGYRIMEKIIKKAVDKAK